MLLESEESQKIAQEFQEYQKKLEEQKKEYKKDHPEQVINVAKLKSTFN